MKDLERFFSYVVGIVVAGLLFWGLITVVKRSFSTSPPPKVDSSKTLQEQRQHTQDILDRQKRLMEDQRQRLKDMQRR